MQKPLQPRRPRGSWQTSQRASRELAQTLLGTDRRIVGPAGAKSQRKGLWPAGSGQREHHSAHGASRSHADLLEQELWGRAPLAGRRDATCSPGHFSLLTKLGLEPRPSNALARLFYHMKLLHKPYNQDVLFAKKKSHLFIHLHISCQWVRETLGQVPYL